MPDVRIVRNPRLRDAHEQVIVSGGFGLPDKTKVHATQISYQASQSDSESSQ